MGLLGSGRRAIERSRRRNSRELERVLKDNPDHSGAIHYYGLAEVYKQRGDKVGEEATRKLFNNAWAEQGGTLDLAKL